MFRDQLSDRLAEAAKAKSALLEKARAASKRDDPEVLARQQARREISEARTIRVAQRQAVKAAEAERKAVEDARLAAEAAAAAIAEAAAFVQEQKDIADREVAMEAERKVARDARYAARKARKGR